MNGTTRVPTNIDPENRPSKEKSGLPTSNSWQGLCEVEGGFNKNASVHVCPLEILSALTKQNGFGRAFGNCNSQIYMWDLRGVLIEISPTIRGVTNNPQDFWASSKKGDFTMQNWLNNVPIFPCLMIQNLRWTCEKIPGTPRVAEGSLDWGRHVAGNLWLLT